MWKTEAGGCAVAWMLPGIFVLIKILELLGHRRLWCGKYVDGKSNGVRWLYLLCQNGLDGENLLEKLFMKHSCCLFHLALPLVGWFPIRGRFLCLILVGPQHTKLLPSRGRAPFTRTVRGAVPLNFRVQ